ncbi:MAG TPA: lactonase family protein [Bacteroidia bacterium]|nr:lactonase family protein [Bacteroidia bacterium]HQF28071.1 lactonase family protein [Bacteroidia bacterium]
MKTILILLLTSIGYCALGQFNKTYLFVGTYTDGQPDKGIYIYEFNSKNGNLKKVFSGENIINPSFLTLSPNGDYLYACTETKLPQEGSVSAFKVDSIKGSLTFLNKQKSGGENPVYVTTSRNNEFVINANYTEGTVSVFKTNRDGSLSPSSQIIRFQGKGPNTKRQDKAHIHAAVFSPNFEYVFFPDLGADKIRVFKFNLLDDQPLKSLENYDYTTLPGSGPRHFSFHPNNKFAYCIEELSGTITAFSYESGKLDSIQRIFSYSKLQEEYNSADIHISPDGLFLYASNRRDNENTISIFSINNDNGKLTLIGHQSTYGDHPRNFTLDPTGNFLIVANQVTNNIVVFKRDTKTGLLTKTGKEINVPRPSCLKMRKYGN